MNKLKLNPIVKKCIFVHRSVLYAWLSDEPVNTSDAINTFLFQFQIQVVTTGWVSLALTFRGSMVGSDIILGWISDTGAATLIVSWFPKFLFSHCNYFSFSSLLTLQRIPSTLIYMSVFKFLKPSRRRSCVRINTTKKTSIVSFEHDTSQRVRMDLNEKSGPKPKTITAWKGTPKHKRSIITRN